MELKPWMEWREGERENSEKWILSGSDKKVPWIY